MSFGAAPGAARADIGPAVRSERWPAFKCCSVARWRPAPARQVCAESDASARTRRAQGGAAIQRTNRGHSQRHDAGSGRRAASANSPRWVRSRASRTQCRTRRRSSRSTNARRPDAEGHHRRPHRMPALRSPAARIGILRALRRRYRHREQTEAQGRHADREKDPRSEGARARRSRGCSRSPNGPSRSTPPAHRCRSSGARLRRAARQAPRPHRLRRIREQANPVGKAGSSAQSPRRLATTSIAAADPGFVQLV